MTAHQMELKAQDLMVSDPVCVEPSITIRQLARVLEENEISGAPVIDKQGRVIGVVSKTDLFCRFFEATADIPPASLFETLCQCSGEDEEIIPEPLICVEDLMTSDPVTVGPSASAGYVAQCMFEKRIHRVVVVDHDRFPVGIITSLDLLGVFPQSAPPSRCCRATANQEGHDQHTSCKHV